MKSLSAARLLVCLLGWTSVASAEEARTAAERQATQPRLSAELTCPPRAGQGRIVCEFVITSPRGRNLRWADVLVVEAPEFALPLRARVVGPVPEEGASRVVVAVPLFARGENTGVVRMRARALVCPLSGEEAGQEACLTLAREVSAAVAVTRGGAIPAP